LKKIQRKAALWIIEVFYTLPTWEVEVIASLISIHFHHNKIIRWYYLQVVFLPKQYVINSLLNEYYSKKATSYHMATCYLCYDFKTLCKVKRQLLYLSNTRKLNRIPVIKCLSYIHLVHGSCYTNLTYSKGTYIVHTIDIWYDIIVSRSFYIFLYTTWLCDCDWYVTPSHIMWQFVTLCYF